MRINLNKINQLIREAWNKGQREALRGAGKSSCVSWSYQVARDYFPDLLGMCFPYGLDAAIEKGDGNVVAMRITERATEDDA